MDPIQVTQEIQSQTQNLLNSANVIGASNIDIANSIITNTLLNSMKTGAPLIDAITSLVFISKFKNQFFKNVSIVFVLALGIIFHRITKSVDILNMMYETILSYYNPYVVIQFIPSKYLKNMILKYNGNVLSIRVDNKQTFFEIKQQYNLLTMLHKVIENYPDIQRETADPAEYLGYNGSPHLSNMYRRLKSNDNYLSYTDFENKEQTKKLSIRIILENLIKFPPKTGKWYKLDNDIQFTWSIVRASPPPPRDPSPSGTGLSSGGNLSRSPDPFMSPLPAGQFYYMLTLKSCVKTTEELQKYLDQSRKELLDKIFQNEVEETLKEQERLNSVSNKDFRGEIYEIFEEETQSNGNNGNNGNGNNGNNTIVAPKHKQYRQQLINTFCRPLESIFFKEKNQLMNILTNFKKKQGIYEKLPHRHKIGIMIYGRPGAGKTSLAVAIATELKRSIIRVSLKDKTLDDAKLSYILNTFKKSYVIILDELDTHKAFRPRTEDETASNEDNTATYRGFGGGGGYSGRDNDHEYGYGDYGNKAFNFGEDSSIASDDDEPHVETTEHEDHEDKELEKEFDKKGIFKGKNFKKLINRFRKRGNKGWKGWAPAEKLTLGSFLEAMDGVSSTEERVVIAMTNHPKHLDPAIIRPGRFDMVINMDSLNNEFMNLYFRYLFKGFSEITQEEIDQACDFATENKVSTSSLEQACIEKYSVGTGKMLQKCIDDVHQSFIFATN